MHSLSNNYDRDYHEELLLNSGRSVQKTIYSIDPDATPEQIKDIVLHSHSNLKTPSQRLHAHQSIQQKPNEALQTYNTRYESPFCLAYPNITIDSAGSQAQCIHYASPLLGKLRDKMEGRFNQDLPESLQAAFEKATNFEPCIMTKQNINTRRMNEVNQINVSHCDDEYEANEAHVRNPNYKGKNYDPNYPNQNKTNNNNSSNMSSNSGSGYYSGNNGGNSNNNKGNFQDKPTNVQVTLIGPVNRDQLFKIWEVLRHPSQYKDKLPPNGQPVMGDYAKSFNKFSPKKVEVNEATIDEVVGFGHFMKKSDAEVTEAIDLYKALRDNIYYGPENQPAGPQQDQGLPTRYDPDANCSTVQTSAPRQMDCFTIALGKATGTTFPIDLGNKHYNALCDTGAGCSLINYSTYEALGLDLDKGYQPKVRTATGENMGTLGQIICTFTNNNAPFTQSFIACRHMTGPVILGTDFTAQNFMGVIWTCKM